METLRKLATGSGAERWMNCPGSVALGKGIIEPPKDYAEEGTKLHKETEQAIKDYYQKSQKIEDIEDPFVQACVREVIEQDPTKGDAIHLEERLELLGSTGGIDCYWIDPVKQIAYLTDYKFGQGVRLEAKGNEQMAFYAVAIREKHPEVKKVYCTLIQPRLEGDFEGTAHVTHWTLGYQTIAKWRRKFEAALKEVELATTYRAGPWCKFCSAKPVCHPYVAFNHAAQEEQLLPALVEMAEAPASIEKIAWMVAQEKRVTGWFPKAKEFLLELAIRGREIPGFQLTDKRSNRQWSEILEPEEIAEKLKERGIDEPYQPRKLISFTDCEKQKVDVSDLVMKPPAGKTLKLLKGEEA